MGHCFKPGLLVILFSSSMIFGQSFGVNSVSISGGYLKLDETVEISLNVSVAGLTGTVVPFLAPSDPADAESMSITWTGTAPTNNAFNLSFNIHLFDDANLCEDSIAFDLLFYGSHFIGPIQATENAPGILSIDTQPVHPVLNHLYADTPPLPFPVSGTDFFLVDGNVDQSEVTNPDNRIFFWADYNLQGFPWNQLWLFFLYALNGGPGTADCTFNLVTKLPDIPLVSGDIIDNTTGSPRMIPQAPLGGAGSGLTPESGVNLWDITDLVPSDPDCNNMSVRQVLNYNTTAPYIMLWQYAGLGNTITRSFRIYIGTNNDCTPSSYNFGTPPAPGEFAIEGVTFYGNGDIEAVLNVPEDWGDETTLHGNLMVEWFLRTDNSIEQLGVPTTALELNLNTDPIVEPNIHFLEARVFDPVTGAIVSTTSVKCLSTQDAIAQIRDPNWPISQQVLQMVATLNSICAED